MVGTQFDWSKRVVSLENLRQMCKELSGHCHRFSVTKMTSTNRVYVSYSNPDEYGNEDPIIAAFPWYPNDFDDKNPAVVLDMIGIVNDPSGYGYQAFDALIDGPKLWRDLDGGWYEHKE